VKFRYLIPSLSVVLLIAGCKPSASDVDPLVRQQVKAELLSYLSGMVTPTVSAQIDQRVAAMSVVINTEAKQADGSYIVTYTVSPPAGYPNFLNAFHINGTDQIDILKSANGWILAPNSGSDNQNDGNSDDQNDGN
jgi:hypothetical protein